MTRVLVCGGRTYAEEDFLNELLDMRHRLAPISLIISGGAPGADTLAIEWAQAHDVNYVVEYAQWEQDGRAAGPIRNQRMLDRHAPSVVIAFPGGRGTADMIRRAQKANVPVVAV